MMVVPDLFHLLSLFTIKPILFAWNLITSGYFELSVYGVEVLWDFSVSRLKFCYGLRQDISMVFAKWKICIDFICLQGMGLIDPRFPLFSCCPRIRYYLSTCF